MRRLLVSDFSCIETADIQFGRLAILIGPQASGKSVLSKLAYFFLNLQRDQFRVLQVGGDLDALRKDIVARFKDWFPVSAWGSKRFQIEFQAGDLQIRLIRTTRNNKMGESLRVWLSPFFEQQFVVTLQSIRGAMATATTSDSVIPDYQITWQFQSSTAKTFKERLGQDFIAQQVFVPAGRAFFTSLGRAIVAFEQGRVLDPLTVQFGRLYTSLKDNYAFRPRGSKSRNRVVVEALEKVLGGKLKRSGDTEFVESNDGRRIPLSALSSGQQELLPLLFVLEFLGEEHVQNALVYIEEPEAHLFPQAQNSLIQELACLVLASTDNGMVLTTHSPYVLAKINNLIKAGSLGNNKSPEIAEKVSNIIPRRYWLPSGFVSAHAVRERHVYSITDDDGLIDGEYLDSVSGDIAREFSSLLEFENSR